MNGYRSLASSPPAAGGGWAPVQGAEADGGKWEGVAVGAATLARNLSSASQRFRAVERSKSTSNGYRGGLHAAVRRAFSMRRQPSSFAEGYWRIHDDMDGDGDAAEQQRQLEQAFEEEQQKKGSVDSVVQQEEMKTAKKKRGHIFKACKKLLGF